MLKKCLICDRKYSGQKNDKQICPECLMEISKEFLSDEEINIIIKNEYIDKFLNGEIAVNCKTEYDAKKLILFLYDKGFKCDKFLNDTHWDVFGRGTYYFIREKYNNLDYHSGICCGYSFFKRVNFKKLKI